MTSSGEKILVFVVVSLISLGIGFAIGMEIAIWGVGNYIRDNGVFIENFKGNNMVAGHANVFYREPSFTGVWKELFDGRVAAIKTYQSGKLDGYAIEFDPQTEELQAITHYDMGVKNGLQLCFDDEQKFSINEYRQGKPFNGTFEEMTDTETITSVYENGQAIKVLNRHPIVKLFDK